MARYIRPGIFFLILLPLWLACASPLPASTTRCTISKAHIRYRGHIGGAEADRRGRAAVGHERDLWNPICTRAMNASPFSL